MSMCLDEELTLGYLRGTLPAGKLEEIELHLDSCDSCQELVRLCARAANQDISASDPTLPAAYTSGAAAIIEPGTRIGRFVVGERIGIGGMGSVWSAYDPELERKVALKFLSPFPLAGSDSDDSGAGAKRLLEEARAMARLSHPNVVAVHDVGVAGADLFVAMELIEGRTLTAWLRERPRSWREIRDAFVQAGRGLVAAHAAKLVHGDFKPDNVLVGVDGRVRVLDFGLALPIGGPGPAGLRGTRGFIAPELRQLAPPDARSDQFSFCVAAWRAFYGVFPPASTASGVALPQIAAAPPPPRSALPPRSVRRALERGLAVDPSARFPSLTQLLRALEHDPWQRPRNVAIAVVLVGSIGAAAWTTQRARHADALCGGGTREAAAVWSGERRAAIVRAFGASHAPYAADASRAVVEALDRYAARWSSAHGDVCRATHVRHERSEQLLDRSMQCLARRLNGLDALSAALAHPDATMIEKSVRAADELPPVDECANAATLEASARAPADPIAQRKLHDAERDLANIQAMGSLGKYKDGVAMARAAVERTATLGLPSVRADLLLELGKLDNQMGAVDDAAATLREALREATAAGSDERVARIMIEQVTTADRSERFAEAIERARDVDAVLARIGGDPNLQIRLDHQRGLAFEMLGKYDDAEKVERRALALAEARDDRPHRQETASIETDLASVATDRGSYAQAIALHRQAIALKVGLYGAEHPALVSPLSKLGTTLNNAEQYEEARTTLMRAVALADKTLPPNHPLVAETLEMLATSLVNLHRPAEAIGYAERALAIHEKSLPAQGRMAAFAHAIVAECDRLQGKLDDALGHARRAVELMEAAQGPKSEDVGEQLTVVGRVLLQQHKFAEAAAVEQRAVAIFESGALGDKNPDLPGALAELGEALLGSGDARRAAAVLARADGLRVHAAGSPSDAANVRFLWGKALWQLGTDRKAALTMADEACATLARDPHAADTAGECRRWLGSHRR